MGFLFNKVLLLRNFLRKMTPWGVQGKTEEHGRDLAKIGTKYKDGGKLNTLL